MAKIIAQRTFTVSRAPKDGKPGEPGKPGDKGEDALTLVITPNTFVFQTNESGEIENLGQNTGKVRMYVGKVEVVPDSVDAKPYNCYARIAGISTLVFDGVSPNQWSGKVEVTAKYKGQTRTATVEFVVSAQKWNEAKIVSIDKEVVGLKAAQTTINGRTQAVEQRVGRIETRADNIEIEVKKQVFGGANLLKGASLRNLNLLLLQREQYVKIVNYPSVAHLEHPYISISRHGATQNEWNGAKFPVIKAIGGKTYTLSMYTRIYGSEQPYIEVKRSRSKDMSAPKNSYPNIPSTYGVWKQYTYTFELEDGYNYLQIFIGCTRNGEAYLSEIQLEEGTKATIWKDPDVVESMEAAGIYLNGNDMSINARSKHFNFIDQQGNVVASVDDMGAINGLKFKTRNIGGGYIDLTGSLMSVFGAVAKNIEFGIDDRGQAILKFYDNAGNNTLNLSPDGIKAESISKASFKGLGVCYIGGMNVLNYSANHSIFDPYFVDTEPSGTMVFLYTGAKLQGRFLADGAWSQSQVEANNGRYFYRNSAVSNNTPVNGVYAARQPQFKYTQTNTLPSGASVGFIKEICTIALYIFQDGKISSIYRQREKVL
ncbi:hypothetical protein [Prevotella falsenii]|uniref:hypothetical protein n=1 Tax=Prevotella falsenii TaxID=515414 RepID=UPI00046A777F|nr:hypothetical protein [Prevotella falsenii]